MNKEVKETIKILQNNSLVKSGSYEFIGDSDITYAEIYILLKFIEDLQQENQQLKIQISAREEKYRKLEETNKVLSQELTKGNLIKQDHLTTCCGIPIGDIPKLIDKNNKLEDNWNKLKEYIEQEISIPIGGREFCCYSNVKDKIKELERGVSDVED